MTHQRQIAILTYGSRGDVEPFVALGAGPAEGGLSRPAGVARAIQVIESVLAGGDGEPDRQGRGGRNGSSCERKE